MKLRVFVLTSLFAPSVIAAQPRVVRLGAFDSTPDKFTRVVALRELADGRAIIADRREVLVAAVSFDAAYSRSIGSVGSGAGQYRAAGPLLPMDGDSTALIDGAAGQWML